MHVTRSHCWRPAGCCIDCCPDHQQKQFGGWLLAAATAAAAARLVSDLACSNVFCWATCNTSGTGLRPCSAMAMCVMYVMWHACRARCVVLLLLRRCKQACLSARLDACVPARTGHMVHSMNYVDAVSCDGLRRQPGCRHVRHLVLAMWRQPQPRGSCLTVTVSRKPLDCHRLAKAA